MDAPAPPPKREVWSPLDKKIIKFLKFNPVMYTYEKSSNPADVRAADNLWKTLAAGSETTVADLQSRWQIIQEKCHQWVNDVLESELSKEDEELIDCLLVIYGQITKLNESRNKKDCILLNKSDVQSSSQSLEPIPSTSKSVTQNLDREEEEFDDDENTNANQNDDNFVIENEEVDIKSEEVSCDEDSKCSDTESDIEMANYEVASDSPLNDEDKEAKEKLFDIKESPMNENACDVTTDALPNLPEVQEDTPVFFEKLGVFVDKELSAKKQREVRLKIWSMITNAELEMISDDS